MTSLDHVMSYKRAGDASRHVGRTNYNEVSSRSHTILQLVRYPFSPGPPQPPSTTPTFFADRRVAGKTIRVGNAHACRIAPAV